MALGGVAAGSMKAHDAATVAGIASISGDSPIVVAVAARIGTDIAVERDVRGELCEGDDQ